MSKGVDPRDKYGQSCQWDEGAEQEKEPLVRHKLQSEAQQFWGISAQAGFAGDPRDLCEGFLLPRAPDPSQDGDKDEVRAHHTPHPPAAAFLTCSPEPHTVLCTSKGSEPPEEFLMPISNKS